THTAAYKKQKLFNQIEDPKNVENREIEISNIKWTEEKTKLLISLYRDMEDQFDKPHQGKKIKLWCLLADKMAVHNYIETGKQCDAKWRTLKTRYKENKKKALQSGEGKITWPYFNLMDSFLSKKAYINPPVKSLLGSKLPSPTKQQSTATITGSSNSVSFVEKPSTSKNLFEDIDEDTNKEIEESYTDGLSTSHCGLQESDDNIKSKKKLKDKNVS
ncbi:trihelix transcription factor GT-3b-like, partial [Aphis craccivora]